jgi:hypothetical protein
MKLMMFWIRRHLLNFFKIIKSSPVITVAVILIAFSLFVSKTNIAINMNKNIFNLANMVLIMISSLNTIKTIDYSRHIKLYLLTNHSHLTIRNIVILTESLFSIFPFIIFYLLYYFNIINFLINKIPNTTLIILLAFSYSLTNRLINRRFILYCSIFIQIFTFYIIFYINNTLLFAVLPLYFIINVYLMSKTKIVYDNYQNIILKIPPVIKSTLYDFISPSFLQPVVIITFIFFYIIYDNLLINSAYNNFLMILSGLLSLNFYLIIDSVQNSNWLFYSVVSINHFFQIKRMVVFLISFFFILILFDLIYIVIIDLQHIYIYISYILFNLIFSICISIYYCSLILKAVVGIIFIITSTYILFINPFIIFILIIPLILLYFLSKINHYGWYYL